MKDYSNVFAKIRDTSWLMTESSLRMMLDIVERRAAGQEVNEDDILAISARRAERGAGRIQASGSIGVIPLAGPIFPKANMMTQMSGATSIEEWRTQFRSLMSNDLVSTIVMDIDSPGGSSDLIMEMGDEIRTARDIKPVVAVANTMAASAAYWLGSQASHFYCTPSGSVGSVGVYAVHEDKSAEQTMKGVKTTFVSAGPNKVDGNPTEPLSATARAHMQARVDEMYGFFLNAVAAGRETSVQDVIDNYGGGRVLSAKDALGVGMIDGVQSLEDTIAGIQNGQLPTVSTSHSSWIYVPTVISATSTGTAVSYDADKEHSEPGTGQGGEPTPRTPPEDGDKGIAGGWRRQTPPIVDELEERSIMNREQLVALAGRLGIAVDDSMTDEELSASVVSGIDEVVGPLVEARDKGATAKSFANDYPEQYAQLLESTRVNREGAAKSFAGEVGTFTDKKNGLSAKVLELVENGHFKLASKQFGLDDFEEIMHAIADNGVISISELGSSRTREQSIAAAVAGSPQEVRAQFASLIKERQEQDSLSYAAARDLVAEENPDLAQAYLNS